MTDEEKAIIEIEQARNNFLQGQLKMAAQITEVQSQIIDRYEKIEDYYEKRLKLLLERLQRYEQKSKTTQSRETPL